MHTKQIDKQTIVSDCLGCNKTYGLSQPLSEQQSDKLWLHVSILCEPCRSALLDTRIMAEQALRNLHWR